MLTPHAIRSRARRVGGAILATTGAAVLLGSATANAQTTPPPSVSFTLAHTAPETNYHAVQFAPAFDGNLSVNKTVIASAYSTALTLTQGGAAQNVTTYCVDFANSLSGAAPYSYGVSLLSTAEYSLGLNKSFQFNSASVNRGDALAYLYANHVGNSGDAAKSAALQLALWKTAYDWDGGDASLLSFTSGNFRISGDMNGAVKTNAESILASLNQWNGKGVDGVAFYSTAGVQGAQALIGPDGNPTAPGTGTPVPAQAIPEPGSMALLAAPLVGMIGARVARRRRRRA